MVAEKKNKLKELENSVIADKMLMGTFAVATIAGVAATAAFPLVGVVVAGYGAGMFAHSHDELKKDQNKLSEFKKGENPLSASAGQNVKSNENNRSTQNKLKKSKQKIILNQLLKAAGCAAFVAGVFATVGAGAPVAGLLLAGIGAAVGVKADNRNFAARLMNEEAINRGNFVAHKSQKESSNLKSHLHENTADYSSSKNTQQQGTKSSQTAPMRSATANSMTQDASVYTIDMTSKVAAPVLPKKEAPKEITINFARNDNVSGGRG